MRASIFSIFLCIATTYEAPTFAQQFTVVVDATKGVTDEGNPQTTHRIIATLTGLSSDKKYKWIITRDGQELAASQVSVSPSGGGVSSAVVDGGDFGEYVFLALPDPVGPGALSRIVRIDPPTVQAAAAHVAATTLQGAFQPGTDFSPWIQQQVEDRLNINRLDSGYSATLSRLAKNLKDTLEAFRQATGPGGTVDDLNQRMQSAWMASMEDVEGVKDAELETLLRDVPTDAQRQTLKESIMRKSPYYKWKSAFGDLQSEIARRGLASNRESLESAYEGFVNSLEPTLARNAAYRANVVRYMLDHNLSFTTPGGGPGTGRRNRGDDACWLYYLIP